MNTIIKNVIKSIKPGLFALIGLASFILGIVCYGMGTGSYQYNVTYGGDAFTGIQNATAQTARNVRDLADVVSFGLGSILLIAGLILITLAVTSFIENRATKAFLPAAQPSFAQPASAVAARPDATVQTILPSESDRPAQPSADEPAGEDAETILARFRSLLDEGLITEEEFNKKAAELKGNDQM